MATSGTNLGTKRERLLDWIRNGSPDDVPVLIGLHNFTVASARLGKDQNEVTWPEAIAVAEETGTHLLHCVGINCELMYGSDLDALRRRTQHVLDSVAGYKHAIGDTNPSYPSYPWPDIQTVIDVVRDSGRLFE